MTAQDYGINITSLKDKIYNFKKQKTQTCFTVTFYYGRQNQEVISRGGSKEVSQIDILLKNDKPDKIKIEFFKGDDEKGIVSNYVLKEPQIETTTPQFQGFGEAEIQNLVDKRLREQKRAEEFERLQNEVSELSTELDEQRDLVDQLEEENEQLKIELEGKKQIRYYAGMLGDILEGIGISKDKIRNPIASLMGIADEKESKEIEQAPVQTQTDSSGIVEEVEQEESIEQKQRTEVITLMTEYLQTRDNLTLSNLFNIFSEVEKDPKIAFEILQFIESKKA